MRGRTLLFLICCFTALLSFKPSEPFLVAFLECVNEIPLRTIIDSVFPVWTYAYLALLPTLSAAAEFIGYRAVVVFGMAGRVTTLLLMLLTNGSVELMQLSQVTIAAGFAAHPALTAIIYRVLKPHYYVHAIGSIAAAGVLAEVASSLLGQILLDAGSPLVTLFIVSTASACAAMLLALALPSPPPSKAISSQPLLVVPPPLLPPPLPRPRNILPGSLSAPLRSPCKGPVSQDAPPPIEALPPTSISNSGANWNSEGCSTVVPQLLYADVICAFVSSGALRYYAWLAVATAVHHLVLTYWQAAIPAARTTPLKQVGIVLGQKCKFFSSNTSNGWVQAASSLLGGVAALLPLLGERCLSSHICDAVRSLLITLAPLALALLLVVLATTDDRMFYSAAFVGFHVLFELTRVLCDAEGARCVARAAYRGVPRFALVSGLSTTATLVLQTAVQFIISKHGLDLSLPVQFMMLAGIMFALFASCVATVMFNVLSPGERRAQVRKNPSEESLQCQTWGRLESL